MIFWTQKEGKRLHRNEPILLPAWREGKKGDTNARRRKGTTVFYKVSALKRKRKEATSKREHVFTLWGDSFGEVGTRRTGEEEANHFLDPWDRYHLRRRRTLHREGLQLKDYSEPRHVIGVQGAKSIGMRTGGSI